MAEKQKRLIIGLTGPIAGGKGVVADYLKNQGFFYCSLSERIREEIRRRGEEISREKLQKVADKLRKKFGPAVLAQRTWNLILKQKSLRIVIDSIRGESEVDFLKSKPEFFLLGVTAPRKLRYQRVVARNRESDPPSWEEFLRIDKKDFKSGQGKLGRDIKKCLEKTDFLIVNDGTVGELKRKIKKILSIIISEKKKG